MNQQKIMTINLDNELLTQAFEIGGFKNKTDTVNTALKEFFQRRKQQQLIELFAKLPADEGYDHKQRRN